jgi:hypothetical protein
MMNDSMNELSMMNELLMNESMNESMNGLLMNELMKLPKKLDNN